MTIRSMTAYSRQAEKAAWGEIIWELRSVNHRFLDLSLRLPEEFNELEMPVRSLVRQNLGRGKIMASLFYIPGDTAPFQLEINATILNQIVTVKDKLNEHFPISVDLVNILKWPGFLSNVATLQREQLMIATQNLLKTTLLDLIASREREGEELLIFIGHKLKKIDEQIEKIIQRLPHAETAHKDRLQSRLAELSVEVDSYRLQQEILFYLQKIDISEEVQRLRTHVNEMKRVLTTHEVVGRRLDFLVQEMQREANTLGNKINDILIQQASVELKVLIEQIREQVQNIE